MGDDKDWARRITEHKEEFDDYWRITYAIQKQNRKIITKMLLSGDYSDNTIKELFEISDFELNSLYTSLFFYCITRFSPH